MLCPECEKNEIDTGPENLAGICGECWVKQQKEKHALQRSQLSEEELQHKVGD